MADLRKINFYLRNFSGILKDNATEKLRRCDMETHNYKQLVMLLCATLLISSVGKKSHALIPVIDAGTIAQSIENNINMALELKSVKKVVELAGKMNTVIGEAMSTFNEYVATYNKYKQQVDKTLGVAADVAGAADGVLGTNISDAVEGVGGAYGDLTSVTDGVVATGGGIADFAVDVQKGAGAVSGGYNAAQDAANQASKFADKEACKKCKKQGGDCTAVCGEEANSGDGVSGNSSTGDNAAGEEGTSAASTSPTGGAGLTASLTGSGTNNGFAILPNELSDYCGIIAADITNLEDKPKVVECLKKLITQRNDKDKETQREARDIYVKSFHETAYANVAEAVVMRNYAVNYEEEVLAPLTEQLKQAKTVRDDYSGVILVNKEIANLINKLLMIYSSKVAYDAFSDYGDFEIYPEDMLNIGDSGS